MAWLSSVYRASNFLQFLFFFLNDFLLASLLNYNFDIIFIALSNLNVIVFFHAAHQVSSTRSHGKSGLAGQTDL